MSEMGMGEGHWGDGESRRMTRTETVGNRNMQGHEGMWDWEAGAPDREPAGQGVSYFCEEPLHAALFITQVAVLVLSKLAMEAFAGSAEILGHASDCLVFSFKGLPLLQLLARRTHVIYLITHPETLPSIFLVNTKEGHCHQHTCARAIYSLNAICFERPQTVTTENVKRVKVPCF